MTPKSAAPTSPAPRPYSAGRPKWSLKRASGKPFAISRPSWNSLTVSEVKGRSDLRGINRAQAQPTGQQEIEKSGADVTEWTPREVARRAIHSVLALGVRQIVAQGLNILGAIFLARLLTPAEFGIYAIIVFIRGFLSAFSGAGLAASPLSRTRRTIAQSSRSSR